MDYNKIRNYQQNNPHTAIIMDAAQSIETFYQGQSSMQVGIASSVSFAPTKTIPTFGSGGAVLTDDDNLAAMARLWRTHGKISNKSQAACVGANSMMSSLETAQLLACINRHTSWQQRREQIAMLYNLSAVNTKLHMPTAKGQHTWHKFVITCEDHITREKLRNFMTSQGIQTEVYYELLINQEEIFRNCYTATPNAEQLSLTSLAIPCQHTLTDEEVNTITQALKDFT
jgi:dTDP-4-amino-4,6-dideoxygalactose transaminase